MLFPCIEVIELFCKKNFNSTLCNFARIVKQCIPANPKPFLVQLISDLTACKNMILK